jgi:hypothetical protein
LRKPLVLTTGPLGGVGDHLIYSTLPERFTKLDYEVYLDGDNLMRNGDMQDLIWGRNPYVAGISDRKPTIGYTKQGAFYELANTLPIGSIEAMERAHGLPPPYGLAPKIYCQPVLTSNLKDVVLADFNSISSRFEPGALTTFVKRMERRFPTKEIRFVRVPKSVVNSELAITGPSIHISSAVQYIEALTTCHAWIGTEAGGQALAAAVRGEHDVYDLERTPHIVCIISPRTYNSRGYTFRGVDYRVTAATNYGDADYWEPAECAFHTYERTSRTLIEQERARWEAEQAPALARGA